MIRTPYLPQPAQAHTPSPLKRKRERVDDGDSPLLTHLLPLDERPPPSKRAHSLEDGFSLMSLASSPTGAAPGPERVTLQSESESRSGAHLPTLRTPEVLEIPVVEMDEDSGESNRSASNGDSGDESHDVEMRRSTWYEKEKDRIVVLDLDSDDEDTPQASPPREYTISSALLARLPLPALEVAPPAPPSGQLVLYRPPLWKDLEEVETRSRNVDDQDVQPAEPEPELSDDAMEIEDD
ncbi:hypothetical protein CALCODRAFT_483824 [Calocera cornea HHB12733]|uniref:Uncharacterized protein n=1 Tax=Calocera cornea HHB12733 TaxID=1353952 RepID=A0A165FCU5_9BASI|nr:hypothetical protein CALCODRAFT_483824 [Calocera cornea HHB12733]